MSTNRCKFAYFVADRWASFLGWFASEEEARKSNTDILPEQKVVDADTLSRMFKANEILERWTSGNYVLRNGQECPACGHDQLEGGEVEIDGRYATQNMWCTVCNAAWTSRYTLSGYEDLCF